MEDRKLELFFDKQLWTDTIEKCVEKRIDRALLTQLCEVDNRVAFARLLQSGAYKIAPPRVGLIPKPNSTEMRKVYINTDLDRLILSLTNDVYFKLYGDRIHENCVSYQKGIGVSKIIKAISNKIVHLKGNDGDLLGYKVDISKYFDNVNKETLSSTLDEIDSGSCLDKIIRDYYFHDVIIDENGSLVEKYKSLAQGSAVSSFLANYVLKDVDEELSKLDIVYYRYSDDILMIGNDAEKALSLLGEMLNKKGLTLNPKKVEQLYHGEWFTFLGFKINGDQVTFSEDSEKRFKDKIKSITKMRKGMKINNRCTQRTAIKNINYYMYTAFIKSNKNFGWGIYFYNTVTVQEDIKRLDEFVKDHIKHMYTGKWNHTTNQNKTSNDTLEELGYVSMVHMYKLFKINSNLFNAEIRRKMM